MAMLDYAWNFSNAQAITASAASTTAVDLSGAGSGNAPKMVFGQTYYGSDLGVGDGMAVPKIIVSVGAAFATLTSLEVAAQFAPDNGSNAAGTYITYAQTGAIPVADLVTGALIGTFNFPKMPTREDGLLTDYPLPRFVQLYYTVAGSNATAGTVNAWAGLQSDNQAGGVNYGSNFSVGA